MMLPAVRRSNPLRFCRRYSSSDGTKKCSDPCSPNSGNPRASLAVITRDPPSEKSSGPSTAAAMRTSARTA